jgi:DNA polymerase I-like protein with 3'-5' exonuclease and polymerase domains
MNIILTEEQLTDLVEHYSQVDSFVFDVETWGDSRGNPHENNVLWISLATYDRVDVIPMGHPNGEYIRTDFPLLPSALVRADKGLEIRPSDYSRDEKKATKVWTDPPEQLTAGEVFSALKPLFFSDKLKIAHNAKFDLESVAKYFGDFPPPPYACTLVASFVLDNRFPLALKECLKREFDHTMVKGIGKEVEAHSFADVAQYSGEDSKWTWDLWQVYSARLEETGLQKLFNLEMDVLEVLCSMELRGADIDLDQVSTLKGVLEEGIELAKGQVWAGAGRVFNINSIREKQEILYGAKDAGGRGLTGRVHTPKGKEKFDAGQPLSIYDFAVSEKALARYAGKDRMVDALIEYTVLNKLLTTYVVPYGGGNISRTTNGKTKVVAKKSLSTNGRIHADFVQYGTETGRFSSRDPNLQNVPNPATENGRAVRNLFVAPEGHKLVVADYSQVEPRIIAALSGDRIMIQNYLDGGDIYTTVGDTLGVTRSVGKVLVLSMAYGVGADKIAESAGCSLKEAKDLLYAFDRKFHTISRYKKQVVSESRNRQPLPYAETLFKRRRYLPELMSKEQWMRARAERQAFNTVIQGSAADLNKLAMVRAYSLVPAEANLVITVHDEIVTVTPDALAEETAAAVREAMENIHALKSVPLIADVKIVSRWGEAK